MKYRITHTTRYAYAEPVPLCHNVARLRPRDTARQSCLRHELVISPVPALRRERLDFFGNTVASFILQEPHTEMSITARSEVDVQGSVDEPLRGALSWEDAAARLAAGGDAALRSAAAYVFASPRIAHAAELADYARPSFAGGRPLGEAVLDLTQRIHREFRFVPGVTSVGTSSAKVLRSREGVCQDFAHLEIGCLRSLGLAARYVSGYVRTNPPPGSERLVGADSSHAWVSVFDPAVGWVDHDPTQGSVTGEAHITAAWARDYDDVAPVKGVLIGGLGQTLKVAVDVVPVTESEPIPG